MSPASFSRRFLLTITLLTVPLPTQAPPGYLAVTSFQDGNAGRPGPGGLWFVHPRDATAPVLSVANLPAELTGANSPGASAGANCVAWRARDGALVVGEVAPTGATVGLQVLQIGAPPLHVASAVRVPLGTVTSGFGGGVVAMATLPGQDILFATAGVSGGVMQGALLGILRHATGTVTPLPVQFPAGFVPALNALTADSTGSTAFVANHLGGPSMDLYRLPITSGSTATWCAHVPMLVSALALDPADARLTAVGFFGADNVVQLDVTTWQQTVSCPGAAQFNGLALEEHTGGSVVLAGPGPGYQAGWMSSPCGPLTLLASPPVGGWGVPSGIVAIPSLRSFGAPSARANSYAWRVRPNAGGLPLIGHAGFGLAVAGTPATAAGIWMLTQDALSQGLPFLGVDLWLNPGRLLLTGSLTLQANIATVSLPVPGNPTLRGLDLYLQTFHLTGLGPTPFDASPGLRVSMH